MKGFNYFLPLILVATSLGGCSNTQDSTAQKNDLPSSTNHQTLAKVEPLKLDYLLVPPENINKPNDDGLTPLMIAAKENYPPETIELLINGGANPYLIIKGKSAFDYGLHGKNDQNKLDRRTKALFEKKIEDNIDKYYDAIRAIYENRLDDLRKMVDDGLYINFQAKPDGQSFVYNANNPKTLGFLLESGADPDLAAKHGHTPLINAVNDNRPEMVTQLIVAGADVNLGNAIGFTPLHFTVNYGGIPAHDLAHIAKQLILAGAKLNVRTKYGISPLYLSILNNKPKTLAVLLSEGADVHLPNNDGRTPLMAAVNKRNSALVSQLIAYGADVNIAPADQWPPLMQAVYYDNLELVSLLLEAGAQVNLTAIRDETPLHLTLGSINSPASNSDLIAQRLIQAGAKLNERDAKGSTLLNKSVFFNKPKIFTVLLSAGADVNLPNNNGCTPLCNAAGLSRTAMARQLISAGADVNLASNIGWTPLINAAVNNSPSLVALLIASGADVNKADNDGLTPLHYTTNDGLTPLHYTTNDGYSKVHNYSEARRMLIEKGAIIDAKSSSGSTPLMEAAHSGDVQAVRELILAGADVRIVNEEEEQRTALDYAVEQKKYYAADILRRSQ